MIKRSSYFLLSVFAVLGCSEDPPGPPLAPVGLTATAISNREIQLSWTDMSDDEHGFVIQRLSGPDRLSGLSFAEVIKASVNASGYTDRKLIPGTNYSYRVSSFNSIGSNYSNVATATTIDQPIPLQVSTQISSSIGMASALGIGIVNADAHPKVSAHGFVWSTEPAPTIELESKTVIESFDPPILEPNDNSWFSAIGALEPSTKYHVRAYTTNALGTVYGNEVTVTTSDVPFFSPGGGVVDVEGNSYKTVIIGGQEWMAENLRAARYTNGDEIPNVTDYGLWSDLKTPAWCHYDNDTKYDGLQGKMYNWFALSNSRNLCPNGWHVPTLSEWLQLNDYLGGVYIAGVRLKSPLPSWVQPDLSTNESGFAAVHSGLCQPCTGLYSTAEWWSSSEVGPYDGKWGPEVFTFGVSAGRGWVFSGTGFHSATAALCVRCVKN